MNGLERDGACVATIYICIMNCANWCGEKWHRSIDRVHSHRVGDVARCFFALLP